MPDVARNTLLAVLVRSGGKVRIGGQYWDAIVWVTGAWYHCLYTGDKCFLALALDVTKNSLEYFEQTEFDATDNLFRGPGWSDGVTAYPDEYADAGGSSGILDWPTHNPGKMSRPGYGIPMKALSTNCLCYNACVTAEKMAALDQSPSRCRDYWLARRSSGSTVIMSPTLASITMGMPRAAFGAKLTKGCLSIAIDST